MVNKVDWFVKKNYNATYKALPCRIRLSLGGKYNGYVVVSKNNPYFGKAYNDIDIDVHGGFTFGCNASVIRWEELDEKYKNEDYWVYGFDTMHMNDTDKYWTKERTLKEIARVGVEMQLAEILQERKNNRTFENEKEKNKDSKEDSSAKN